MNNFALVALFPFIFIAHALNFRKLIESVPNPLSVIPRNECIEDLGCFYTGAPFLHPLYRPISLSPVTKLKTKYLLYTPSSKENPEELSPTVESVKESIFDPDLPTKILIHGFLAKYEESDWQHLTKDAFLETGQYNVILLYWTEHNGNPYPQAVANDRVVGAQAAKLIKLLVDNKGITGESVHCIGHSLGGQMCGWIGERLRSFQITLGRITGLDPAGPYFRGNDPTVRLDVTDAKFVDVIHTDSGDFLVGIYPGLGISEAIGHLDFYPNGGEKQPGCSHGSDPASAAIDMAQQFFPSMCSHSRAYDLFRESIINKKCRFLSVECKSYDYFEKGQCLPCSSKIAEMGLNAKPMPDVKPGSRFYLKTGNEPLYCIENGCRM